MPHGLMVLKRCLFAFLLASLSLLIGCSREPTPVPPTPAPTMPVPTTVAARRPALGEQFSLQGGATTMVDIPGDARGSAMEVQFFSVVSDSRCPRLVECVVAGDATIQLNVTFGQATQVFMLHTTPPLNRDHELIADYDIQLIGLDPQMERFSDNLTTTQYTAQLTVVRVGPATATPAMPRATATPTAAPPLIQRPAINACTLVSTAMVENAFGSIQGTPQVQSNPDGSQGCVIQAERGVITIRFVLGDQATVVALVRELQQTGVPLEELSDQPLGRMAFGQNQQQAMLVAQNDTVILAIGVTFANQVQPNDHQKHLMWKPRHFNGGGGTGERRNERRPCSGW